MSFRMRYTLGNTAFILPMSYVYIYISLIEGNSLDKNDLKKRTPVFCLFTFSLGKPPKGLKCHPSGKLNNEGRMTCTLGVVNLIPQFGTLGRRCNFHNKWGHRS